MKIDKMILGRILVGILIIALFIQIYFLTGKINLHEKKINLLEDKNSNYEKEIALLREKTRVDEITINQVNENISKLKEEFDELSEQYSAMKVENTVFKLKERTDSANNRKNVVDETMNEEGVWLIPQVELYESDEFDLNSTRPYVYEYVDDSIYIYYFKHLDHLNIGMNEVEDIFGDYTERIYQHTLKDNILIIYIPYDPENTEHIERQIEKLERAFIAIEEKLN